MGEFSRLGNEDQLYAEPGPATTMTAEQSNQPSGAAQTSRPTALRPTTLATAAHMVRLFVEYRAVLWATTQVELSKKYAGSLFGKLWVLIYPALLLATYLFVFRVIFGIKLSADAAERLTGLPGDDPMVFVLYVFCGLIPYIGFSEAVTAGCTSLKQNMHLIKNVIVPIELIGPRVVAVAMVSQLVSLVLLLILVGFQGVMTFHLLWLPVVVLLQTIFQIGLVWLVSALGVLLPDVSYFVNILVLFLLYVSPIVFEPSAVPGAFRILVYVNPIYYMIESYRSCLLFGRLPELWPAVGFVVLALSTFVLGAVLFRRLKPVLVDWE